MFKHLLLLFSTFLCFLCSPLCLAKPEKSVQKANVHDVQPAKASKVGNYADFDLSTVAQSIPAQAGPAIVGFAEYLGRRGSKPVLFLMPMLGVKKYEADFIRRLKSRPRI